jgi:MYXO-CTERM domain-containing protein
MRNALVVALSIFVAACSVDPGPGRQNTALLASPDLVIANVYGGGSNTGATFNQDFAVIFNRGTDLANLGGLSLFYASGAGTFTTAATSSIALTGKLFPGATYLVTFGAAGAVGAALPTADLNSPTMNLGSTAGKLALAPSNSVIATNGCTTACDPADWTDLVGWGTTATLFETAKGPATTNTTELSRALLGCTDAGNNSTDFTAIAAVAPRNSATTATPCTPVDFAGLDLTSPPDLTPPPDLTTLPPPDLMGYSLLLNEVRWNPPGADTGEEYIELIGAGAIPINTYVISVDGDSGSAGRINYVHDVSGLSVGSNGLLLIEATTTTFADVDPSTTLVADTALTGSPIQNGTESVLVISSPVPLTLVAGVTLYTSLANITILDSLTAMDTGGTAYGAASIAPCPTASPSPIDGASRIVGNTTPQSIAAWYAGQAVGTAPAFLGLDDTSVCTPGGPPTWSMSPGRVNSSPQTGAPDLAFVPDMTVVPDGGHETSDIGVGGDLSVGDLAGTDGATAQFPDLSEAILPPNTKHSGGCAMSDAPSSGAAIAWVAMAAAFLFLRRRRAQTTKA